MDVTLCQKQFEKIGGNEMEKRWLNRLLAVIRQPLTRPQKSSEGRATPLRAFVKSIAESMFSTSLSS